jgi:signal transduction histidine kinase
MDTVKSRGVVLTLCVLMFVGIVALDVLTPQRLVAAILLNIPIALSGLTLKRRFTFGLVFSALITDLLAGLINAQSEGGFDTISLLNRTLLAASFVLVGAMTVLLSQTSSRLSAARDEELRVRRERDREAIAAAGQERSLAAALTRAAEHLARSLEARGAVLATGGTRVFAEPRATFPPGLASWQPLQALPTQLIGTAPKAIIHTAQPGDYALNANNALIAGVEWGGRAPILLALLEPSGEADTLEELLPVLRDALERAELSERLELGRAELERRAGVIRDLVYAFSHDLRTPITANGVNMRLALEGAFGALPEEYRRTLVNGMEANEDLLSLADSLLLLARMESGEAPARREELSLEAAARSVAARLPAHAKIEWHVSGDSGLTGSPADLRRVLQNLLENAAKHNLRDAPIEVSLERVDNTVRLTVADRGSGVPLDLEPRLFQRFSSAKAGGGTGLGLYLARRIVDAHGGRIGYHPRIGGGSVFWVELPASVPAPEAVTA